MTSLCDDCAYEREDGCHRPRTPLPIDGPVTHCPHQRPLKEALRRMSDTDEQDDNRSELVQLLSAHASYSAHEHMWRVMVQADELGKIFDEECCTEEADKFARYTVNIDKRIKELIAELKEDTT